MRIIVVFFICLYVNLFAIDNSKAVVLTQEEQEFLKNNTITMCVDPDWEPFEVIKNGTHIGIAADLISLISVHLNTKIKLIPTTTWEQTIEFSKAGKCDILSFLNQTPAREKWLVFTEPIFRDPNVLIGRMENSYIEDISTIKASIALPKQTAMSERFKNDFPQLIIVPVDSENEAFKLVEERKVDLTLRSMIVAAHTIKQNGLFNLKIIGQPKGYENILRIGVVQNKPIIKDILNKSIATITQEDTDKIVNNHVKIVIEKINYITPNMWLFLALFGVSIVLFLSFLYYKKRFHSTYADSEIDALTGVYNRKKFNLDFERLFAKEYGIGTLSIIIVDIDLFKRVNDVYGHDVGDTVIKYVAKIISNSLNQDKLVYRWGGEEFIILFENSLLDSAVEIAEQIKENLAKESIGEVGFVTCSYGIASKADDDTTLSLFKKADNNLYKAKQLGRNCIVR